MNLLSNINTTNNCIQTSQEAKSEEPQSQKLQTVTGVKNSSAQESISIDRNITPGTKSNLSTGLNPQPKTLNYVTSKTVELHCDRLKNAKVDTPSKNTIDGINFQRNFIQIPSGGRVNVEKCNIGPAHKSQILSRTCVCFNNFMNHPPGRLPAKLDAIRANLHAGKELTPVQQNLLMDHLASSNMLNDNGNPLYVNKLFKPEHAVLELPGDAAMPSKAENGKIGESITNKILVEKFGFPETILQRQEGKHETYSILAFTNAKGQDVSLGELFGGGLQGIYRTPAQPEHSELAQKHPGYHNNQLLASGGYFFTPGFNEKMYSDNIDTVGKDILDFALNLNLDNDQRKNMEGFTAGVSGNALHYVIQSNRYCSGTNQPFDFEDVLETCRDHLVGDNVHQPLHHSLPEVIQGAYIGKMLIDTGVVDGKKMTQESMLINLNIACNQADDKIEEYLQSKYSR